MTEEVKDGGAAFPDELKDAAVVIALLASLGTCDREYQADYLLSHRDEIVSTMRLLMSHAIAFSARSSDQGEGR